MPERQDGRRPRSFWSGTISFGLVSVPVDLYPANRSGGVSLRMLDEDGTPLARRYLCPKDDRLLENDEIVRGYEVEEREFVVVTDEELAALAPEKSRDIDLRRFVPADGIDPMYFERGYFLAPGGESTKAYRLLAQAMEETGRAGVGSFVLRGKEHPVAIVAERGLLRAVVLRFAEEVRSPEDVGLSADGRPPKAAVRRMARAIEERTEAEIDPEELRDRNAERLRSLIEEKAEERRDVVAAPSGEAERDEVEIVDLMEVLKRRLGSTGRRRQGAAREKGHGADLDDKTKDELYALARDLDIEGRSRMNKADLIRAIRRSA